MEKFLKLTKIKFLLNKVEQKRKIKNRSNKIFVRISINGKVTEKCIDKLLYETFVRKLDTNEILIHKNGDK